MSSHHGLQQIDDHIYCCPGQIDSNIFYFDCHRKAIIDTGHPENTENILHHFSAAGVDLTDINYIINTHSHGDHVGNNAFLKKHNPRIQILSSNKTTTYQNTRKEAQLLAGTEDHFTPYSIDRELGNNDVIDLGNIQLSVIETPGHTIDSISLYYTKKKWMFCGDTIYNNLVTQFDYYQPLQVSASQLEDTYQKLTAMDINRIYTGHSAPVTEIDKNFTKLFNKLNKFKKMPELYFINTFIPSLQFHVHKYPGKKIEDIKAYFLHNVRLIKYDPQINEYSDGEIMELMDKIISLMLLLSIIKEEGSKLYLKDKINQYIGKK